MLLVCTARLLLVFAATLASPALLPKDMQGPVATVILRAVVAQHCRGALFWQVVPTMQAERADQDAAAVCIGAQLVLLVKVWLL